MEYKIIWSEAAIADLRQICAYIARSDPRAAQRVGKGILDHVGILATFPYIGPVYPRGTHGPLHEVVFRPYRIFYDVSEQSQQVQIVHIWHGARQEPRV